MTSEEWEKKWGSLPQEPFEEKDAEIEQLKQYACQCEASVHSTQAGYAELQAEIEQLKELCTRAADALEFWMKDLASTEQQYVDAAMRDERLLSELRKASE